MSQTYRPDQKTVEWRSSGETLEQIKLDIETVDLGHEDLNDVFHSRLLSQDVLQFPVRTLPNVAKTG